MVRSIDCRTRHRTSAALLTLCSSFFLAKKWHAATSSLRETVFVRNSNKQFSAVSRHLESITCRNLQISYFAVAVTSPALRCRRRRAAAILSPVAFLPRQVCGNCECIMPLNIPIFPSFKKRRAKGVFFSTISTDFLIVRTFVEWETRFLSERFSNPSLREE